MTVDVQDMQGSNSGADANIFGNYNLSSIYKYNDSFLNSLNYMGEFYYLTNYFNYYLLDNSQNNFGSIVNFQIDEDNILFSYKRFLEKESSEGRNEFNMKYMTRFSNRFFSNFGFSYIDYDDNDFKNDFLLNYRLYFSLYKRWLPKFFRNIDFVYWGDYSFISGVKSNNFKIEKNLDELTKYSFFYEKFYLSNNFTNTNYKLELKHDFSQFYGVLNFSYNPKDSFKTQIGFGVNLGYNDKLQKLYLSSWKEIGRGSVSIVPYNDLDGNLEYSRNDKILSEAFINVNGGQYRMQHNNKIYHSSSVINYENNSVNGNEFTDGDSLFIPKYKNVGFKPRPNLSSTIYYPYIKTTELSVLVLNKNTKKPMSGIIVELHNNKTKEIITNITDLDGEVFFDRIKPTDYSLILNREQMGDLRFKLDKQNILVSKTFLDKPIDHNFKFQIIR